MSYPLPRMSVVLGYKDLFGQPLANRLSLISNLSKDILILELAGLNYRLSGKLKKEIDTTFETQLRELSWFCGRVPALRAKYAFLLDKVGRGKRTFVFTRQGCLFAMEEISQSDIPVIPDFKMNADTWEPLLLYLLAVNDEVTHYEEAKKDEPVNFETLSPKMLPLSELLLINDPFYVVHRGLALMDYLAQDEMIRPHLIAYFQKVYGIPYDHFIFELHRMWMANKTEPDHLSFYYSVDPNSRAIPLFEALSSHYASNEPQKLLNIRKNPFFKRENSHYMLTDLTILLDKAYYQFINDFWFDQLKGQQKPDGQALTMQDFKSVIGYFFESYVADKLNFAFRYARGYVLRKFDELKFQTNAGESEEKVKLVIFIFVITIRCCWPK